MITVGKKVSVGTTSARIYYCRAADINNLTFRAVGACTIGLAGGGTDDGIPLTAGEAVSFSKTDFPNVGQGELFEVYGVAAVATDVNVYGFLRE